MVVQQVVDLAAVDLVHRHGHREVAALARHRHAAVKEVPDSQVLEALHREGLARARLAVGKDGHHAGVEDVADNGPNGVEVELLGGFLVRECLRVGQVVV